MTSSADCTGHNVASGRAKLSPFRQVRISNVPVVKKATLGKCIKQEYKCNLMQFSQTKLISDHQEMKYGK